MMFALALGLYFLLSVKKYLFVLYVLLFLTVAVNGYFFVSKVGFTLLLLCYLTVEASLYLKRSYIILSLVMNSFFSMFLMYSFHGFFVEIGLFSVLIYFLILKLNTMIIDRKEQKDIYEKLLEEYRKVKRLAVQAERNARLEERTKIARDIHDSVGHRLTALIMKLEILAIQNVHMDYSELKDMAQESLNETRQAVNALQTEENEGIATVVHLIRKLEAESHLLVQFTMKQGILSIPISNETSVVLYRVIQEALTNAMRHAQSREVHITLGKSATDAVSFEIRNSLFHRETITYGFGLTNMKKRVEEREGTLEAYPTDKEFIVRGSIPSE